MKKIFLSLGISLLLSSQAYAAFGDCGFGDCSAGGGGSGTVSSATINQCAYYSAATTVAGDAGCTYDPSTDVLGVSTITGTGLYAEYLSTANIKWLGTSDSIATAITDATAGDTIILGAGTYSFTTLTINKALKIIGQGAGKTILASSSTTGVAITANANNIVLSDLSVTQTATSGSAVTIFFTGTAGTVLTGGVLRNVESTYTLAANSGTYNAGIQVADASINIYNCKITSTNSGTGNIAAIIFDNQSTAEAITTSNIYNSVITTTSSAGSGTPVVSGIQVADISASQNVVVNVYQSIVTATDSLAGATTYSLLANVGSDAKLNSYSNILIGTDGAYSQANSAVLTAYNDTVTTDAASGAVWSGTLKGNAISLSGTVTSSRTTDLGWSVVAGANTACNTTCTFACAGGQDTDAATKPIVDCADATADRCFCAGAN